MSPDCTLQMLRVNLSARTDVTAISLDYFSCRAHPLLILKAQSDHGRMHNSYYLVVRCVRYSWDLEGLQEKMGRTGLCYSLFPEGGKRGICLGWSGNIFLGGAANREGELVFKKREKKTRFIINRTCESSCAWNLGKIHNECVWKNVRLLLLLVP